MRSIKNNKYRNTWGKRGNKLNTYGKGDKWSREGTIEGGHKTEAVFEKIIQKTAGCILYSVDIIWICLVDTQCHDIILTVVFFSFIKVNE